MSTLLLVLGAALFFVAFVIYNWRTFKGEASPAFAAWAVFSVITFVNCLTYLSWSRWENILVMGMDFVICVGTTLVMIIWRRDRLAIDWTDRGIVALSLVAMSIWLIFDAGFAGNMLNLVAYTITFIPTYRNVIHNPDHEPTGPWAMWTVAFGLNLAALPLQSGTTWVDYIAPGLFTLHHLAITLLSLRQEGDEGSPLEKLYIRLLIWLFYSWHEVHVGTKDGNQFGDRWVFWNRINPFSGQIILREYYRVGGFHEYRIPKREVRSITRYYPKVPR